MIFEADLRNPLIIQKNKTNLNLNLLIRVSKEVDKVRDACLPFSGGKVFAPSVVLRRVSRKDPTNLTCFKAPYPSGVYNNYFFPFGKGADGEANTDLYYSYVLFAVGGQ